MSDTVSVCLGNINLQYTDPQEVADRLSAMIVDAKTKDIFDLETSVQDTHLFVYGRRNKTAEDYEEENRRKERLAKERKKMYEALKKEFEPCDAPSVTG